MPRMPLAQHSRFAWLMGLYAENFQRIEKLLAPAQLRPGHYLSRTPQGLDLMVDVLELHPYTVELRLSYRLLDPVSGQPDPSAYVRIYRDARVAEVTHCYVGRHWQDVLGLNPSAKVVFGHRLRMNSFLNKWLDYLGGPGQGQLTLRPFDTEAPDEEIVVCA